eukprot:COSAG02_NODE_1769_length_10996_cov_22.332385_9_plen_110_part_00
MLCILLLEAVAVYRAQSCYSASDEANSDDDEPTETSGGAPLPYLNMSPNNRLCLDRIGSTRVPISRTIHTIISYTCTTTPLSAGTTRDSSTSCQLGRDSRHPSGATISW